MQAIGCLTRPRGGPAAQLPTPTPPPPVTEREDWTKFFDPAAKCEWWWHESEQRVCCVERPDSPDSPACSSATTGVHSVTDWQTAHGWEAYLNPDTMRIWWWHPQSQCMYFPTVTAKEGGDPAPPGCAQDPGPLGTSASQSTGRVHQPPPPRQVVRQAPTSHGNAIRPMLMPALAPGAAYTPPPPCVATPACHDLGHHGRLDPGAGSVLALPAGGREPPTGGPARRGLAGCLLAAERDHWRRAPLRAPSPSARAAGSLPAGVALAHAQRGAGHGARVSSPPRARGR